MYMATEACGTTVWYVRGLLPLSGGDALTQGTEGEERVLGGAEGGKYLRSIQPFRRAKMMGKMTEISFRFSFFPPSSSLS